MLRRLPEIIVFSAQSADRLRPHCCRTGTPLCLPPRVAALQDDDGAHLLAIGHASISCPIASSADARADVGDQDACRYELLLNLLRVNHHAQACTRRSAWRKRAVSTSDAIFARPRAWREDESSRGARVVDLQLSCAVSLRCQVFHEKYGPQPHVRYSRWPDIDTASPTRAGKPRWRRQAI